MSWDLRLRLLLLEILHAGIQPAASERAERHDLLAAEVSRLQKAGYRRSVRAEPDGITEENHIISLEVAGNGLNFRDLPRLHFLPASFDGFLDVSVISS